MWHKTLITLLFTLTINTIAAQYEQHVIVGGDTITYNYTPLDQTTRSGASSERSFGRRLDDYQHLSVNDSRRAKFSFVGAPAYSSTTGWRLVVGGTLEYLLPGYTDRQYPSHLTLNASGSLTGYYQILIDGYNRLNKHIFKYGGGVQSQPSYIYGLDYKASHDNTASQYTDKSYNAWFHYEYMLPHNMRIGIMADYISHRATDLDLGAEILLDTHTKEYSGAGFGLSFGFNNSRRKADVGSPLRGFRIYIEALTRPRALSNLDTNLYQFEVLLNYYQPLWRGAYFALDIMAEHHSLSTPWMLRAELGGDNRMRGYYKGRYNGNNLITTQLELRQHIWNGIGFVVWVGAGSAFTDFKDFSTENILPNYGAGLRYEINATTTVRFDVGFGRDCHAFVLGMNEAF